MRVGTSGGATSIMGASGDHPHACGDKVFGMPSCVKASGSSPCVWGQDSFTSDTPQGSWIIPMRVGTSMQMTIRSNGAMDHPHACGDKLTHKQSPAQRRGSSPCVWGQANTDTTKRERMRIIPTRMRTR